MTELKELKELVKAEIEKLKYRSTEMANHIFNNPEQGLVEFKSRDYLVKELKRNGFKISLGVGGLETSFCAEFDILQPGPSVAFIAEYDALPILGHACHHHIIASASVNTAIALKRIADKLRGKIICIGTPAEECMDVKGMMIRNSAFKGIDAALMIHGGDNNNNNLIVLAMIGLEFSFKGKASHAAAAPHEGVNALDGVIMLFNAINALRQQLKDGVRIHGNIIQGGDAVNVIPEFASARISIRANDLEYLNLVIEKVKNCAKGAALQTGTKLTVSVFEDIGNNLLKNIPLAKEYNENFESLGQEIDSEPFLLGSSDIGNLSHRLPALHPMVKTAESCSLHTVEFLNFGKTNLAYNGMINGMKAMGMTAVRILMDSEFLKSVKEDFKKNKIKESKKRKEK